MPREIEDSTKSIPSSGKENTTTKNSCGSRGLDCLLNFYVSTIQQSYIHNITLFSGYKHVAKNQEL